MTYSRRKKRISLHPHDGSAWVASGLTRSKLRDMLRAHKLRRYPNPLYDYFGSCTSEFHLDDNQSVFVMSHIERTGFSITLSDRAEYLDDRRRWRPYAAMFYASLHSKDT